MKNLRFKIKKPPATNFGFTLVELLVAMAILAILASIGFGAFFRSQQKARDGRRKSDLHQLQQALEAYANDHRGSYPLSDSIGQIVVDGTSLAWGGSDAFEDLSVTNGAVYMQQLPADRSRGQQYFYWSDANGSCYKIYAKLENVDDRDIVDPAGITNTDCDTTAGVQNDCNYGVSSSNTTVTGSGC